MNSVRWIICFTALITLGTQFTFSQSTNLNTLTITGVYAEKDYAILDNDYRWKIWLNNDLVVNCIKKSGDPGWYDVSIPFVGWFIPNVTTELISLGAEAWQENGCDPSCEYNTGTFCRDDEGHCKRNDTDVSPYNYQPGMTNSIVIWPCTSGNPYAVRYIFSYDVPLPQKPSITSFTTDLSVQICDANPIINLNSASFINPSFLSRAQFQWQYQIGGGPWTSWRTTFPTVNGGQLSFSNIRELTGPVTTNTSVRFRVSTRYVATNGLSYTSGWISSDAIQVSPLPPTINSFSSTISCPNKGTGSVEVSVSGFGEYMYALRPGMSSPGGCIPNPGLAVDPCGGESFRVAANTFTFQNKAAGAYTLAVFNNGSTGVCFSYVYVNVEQIPVLQLETPAITPVTCHGGSDGAVTLASSGGTAPFQYTLTKSSFTDTNDSGVFNSLLTGTYTSAATDGCDQLVSSPVVISEPLNILADFNYTSPSCNSPANGSIAVNITQGEGTYSFNLLKDGEPMQELNNATTNRWVVNNLGDGDYAIAIKDAERLQCEGLSSSSTLIAAPAFEINASNITTQNVSCFGRDDGHIKLINTDNSGSFEYLLFGGANGPLTTSTTLLFPTLKAGSYSLSMRRNIEGCNDLFEYDTPIEITQPEEIIITLNKQDISCFEETDGKIVANVQGSTATDRYTWETKIGANWATLSNTTTTLQNLVAGDYRFKMSNDNGCTAQSNEVEIIEPAKLTIETVTVNDIKCLGDKGGIETILNGGTAPYVYNYSSSNDVVQSSTAITSLKTGVYTLEVEDVNGCKAAYTDILTITEPIVPLVFVNFFSDYNGYNISCAGAQDGWATFVAWGGGYDGSSVYEYGLDGSYIRDKKIENISAGLHILSVRDARGCVVAKNISFSEPENRLQGTLARKEDVKCSGDVSGILSIEATGGLSPYSFKLFDQPIQQSGVFVNLAPGQYTVTIADKNGCTTEYTDEIRLLTPPIQVEGLVTNVRCHGGSDGIIQVNAEGGDQPLRYRWEGINVTTPVLQNVTAGNYVLTVTDQQDCSINLTRVVTEPAPLVVNVIPIPVCVGKSNGELRVQASGGTGPFLYSIDGGNNYQSSTTFANVPIGTYTVLTSDQNNCKTTYQAEVLVRSDIPEPDFIVATKENALDTLIVKEISIPKPDSVVWTFDQGITIVNQDTWSPEVTVKEPGTYYISLKGYFGGCDYTKSIMLTINPYDPENSPGALMPVDVIKAISVSPNPNSGAFTVNVDLNVKQHVSMKVFDLLGITHISKTWDKTLHIEENVNFTSSAISQGIYIVQVITDTDAREVKIVINP